MIGPHSVFRVHHFPPRFPFACLRVPLPAMRRLFTVPFAWIGSRGGLFLAVILLIVAGTWAFIHLADEVRERETERFDARINRLWYEHPGPKWVRDAGRDVTALGGVTAVVGYLLLSARYGMAGLVLVATLGGLCVTSALKHWIDRPRPPLHQSDVIVYTTSFPSGHSALSAATYLTLGTLLARSTRSRTLKFYFLFLALMMTFLVGLSRVYLGAHYPTDVLAGWCVGLVWALICWAVARELQHRRVVEGEQAVE
jgi:undecaprenyl-diphosphatase